MVVATTFASNVARLKTLAEAGRAAGRAGRGARAGDEHHAEDRPCRRGARRLSRRRSTRSTPTACRGDNLLVLATGSQGERRAASAQLAQGNYMGLELQAGRHLPVLVEDHPRQRGRGRAHPQPLSEKGVTRHRRQRRALPRLGPRQPARPRDAAGAGAAADAGADARRAPPPVGACGARRASAASPAAVAPNGTMLDLTGDAPRIVEQVETGRVYLDGTVLIGAMDGVVRERIRMAMRGHVAVSVIIDERGRPLGGAWVDGDGPAGQPEDARRSGGRAGGGDRPGAGAGQAGGARRRRRAGGADPAGRARGSATTRSARSRSAR